MGDILFQCSGGAAGTAVSGNLNIFLPVNITNRVSADGTAVDVSLAVDTGASPAPTPVAGRVSGQSINFNGISFTLPASGGVTMRITNLRGNANQASLGAQQGIQAFISTNLSVSVALSNNPVTVARPARGFLGTLASSVIRCGNSPLPNGPGLRALYAAGTVFASTRITEGFPEAFQPKDAATDSGTRIMARYTNIPAGVRVFAPDLVAGADAAQPTAAGDLGGSASAGQYVPGSGALLLSRVLYTDENGAGGIPAYNPSALSFEGASEAPVVNGTAIVVYEVADASPLRTQSAQFPTFFATTGLTAAASIQETLLPAPLSAELAASTSAPIPRFAAVPPPSDCTALGDCNSDYFPRLSVYVQPVPLQFSATTGGLAAERGYIPVNNKGGGVMTWNAAVTYKTGTDWLRLDPSSGVNNLSVMAYASAANLAPGTYEATITVDAGAVAGTVNLPVVFVVRGLPAQPPPAQQPAFTIASVTNAANFLNAPVAPGSLATIKGVHLAGRNVGVTIGGVPARLLYASDTQINLQVPAALAGKDSAQLVLTVDGTAGPAQTVALAAVAPAVFAGGVLNQDGTANGAAAPAAPGSVLQIFATGLAAAGANVTVKIHDQDDLLPAYAGPAPGLEGVDQVNVAVPGGLPAMPTSLLVCARSGGQRVCSHPAPLVIGTK